ncbi:hypothetical protein WJX75_008607 [Coccomyxa subellipsoidea]|uniref:TPR-like protein n=1 Tax=Coccomyxa subellipsoidea TaxID=248742 RepID=A0ABR2YK02_9CHLO
MQGGISGNLLNAHRPVRVPFKPVVSAAQGVRCQSSIGRRTVLQLAPATWLLWNNALASPDPALAPAKIRLDLAPDQSKYNPADERLRDAAGKLQLALNAEDVKEEERLWTELIDKYEGVDANWRADIVGRAYGNRGNARTRQGKMDAALADYNKAIAICPWSVDPVLNRGVLFENTGRYEEAFISYRTVLDAAPNDPSGWNNMGNVSLAMGKWDEAASYYQRAIQLAPAFSFAAANRTLALYAGGKTNEAMREMRTLLRRAK